MKYIGIDYGSKRVGIAVSDEGGSLAFPHSVLENGKDLMGKVKEIISAGKIEVVVLGESKNFKGEPNVIMEGINSFKSELEKETGIQIIFEPEFLTSQQAERFTGKNDMLDASAAALILQSYLDRETHVI